MHFEASSASKGHHAPVKAWKCADEEAWPGHGGTGSVGCIER